MGGFKDIIGQEQIIEYIKSSINQNKIYHAYIINGEDYSGKKTIAKEFAMALQCENDGEVSCGSCRSCIQAKNNNQPDIIWVEHENITSIGVDDIRVKINKDVVIKPYSSKYKIYIVEDAELMTEQAQNALLKTIEEPPEYVVIILLCNNQEKILPTVISRCIALNIQPVKTEVIKEYLINNLGVDEYTADICSAYSRGNLGKAKNLAMSEAFIKIKDEAISLTKSIKNMEFSELIRIVNSISDYKVSINDFFDILMLWYRDVLMFKAVNDANDIIFKGEVAAIINQAGLSSYNGIERILEGIERAKKRLKANVNFELTMELLFLTLKEN